MPRARMLMRKIRELLRLKWERGLSHRQAGRAVGIGLGTVCDYLQRAVVAGLSWEAVAVLGDEELEQRLFPSASLCPPTARRRVPDWAEVHRELKRKGVTLSLLWQEYRGRDAEGYGYSRYCELYRAWEGKLDYCLRQDYVGGEKLIVDYAGQTVTVHDVSSGDCREAAIFVAVLGASNYTYAEATWSQDLADWIGSHVRAFTYLGGVSEILIPDNLKSGVTTPCRYEPLVNRTYAEMAAHYGVVVIPARIRKPRDKAKGESGVLQVSRWILARLRNDKLFSLRELNDRIGELLVELNRQPLKVLGISRRQLFERVDQPALRPLPPTPYDLAEWKDVRVGPDYHVEYEGHYYSVPYQLLREQLELRAAARTVEVFRKGKRVAAHRRDQRKGQHSTLPEHMPKAHQAYLEWTPTRLVEWANKTGSATAELVTAILRSRLHPQQGFRSCLGLMRLSDRYGAERLEAASGRALAIRSFSYKSVKSILDHGLDRQSPAEPSASREPIVHANVRGAAYYQGEPLREETDPC
jgi:transposase